MVDDPFFAGGEIDEEIERKLQAMAVDPDALVEALFAELTLMPDEVDRLRRLWRELIGDGSDVERVDYCRHAARIAASLVRRGRASYGDVALALAHNVHELEWFDGDAIATEFVPAECRELLTLLDTDRSRDHDPNYLAGFYDAIAVHPELLVLKALDKLDNALSYVLWDLEDRHRAVVVDVLCPRLSAVDARLAAYLAATANHVASDDVKARYR